MAEKKHWHIRWKDEDGKISEHLCWPGKHADPISLKEMYDQINVWHQRNVDDRFGDGCIYYIVGPAQNQIQEN